MGDLYQCPSCGYQWRSRLSGRDPKYCPRCHKFLGTKIINITEGDRVIGENELPIWEKEGKLEIYEIVPKACDICGRQFKRVVKIDGRRYCRECLWRLLDPRENDISFM